MRRFSQRNQLVTLNEINVTPLLDLAFVLLIIFIITTPLLDNSIPLTLPAGGARRQNPEAKDVVLAEVNVAGVYFFRGRRMDGPAAMEKALRDEYLRNPNMVVRIRADADGKFRHPAGILEMCRKNGITRFDIATESEHR
ncbi:MAG: biopolymer transporter ExbD [Verrucomicrobia bacterium]|nr:MAG: biopolymer transporter ExbD [Verrucomicrobiota bacterium]